jgi:hypothetical protein
MKAIYLLAAAPLLIAASPEEELRKDVRCFVAVGMLGQQKDENVRSAAMLAAQYFLGRIDGRAPAADLEDLVAREAPTLTEAETGQLLRQCGALMEKRGKDVVGVGEKLKARGL